MEKRIVLTILVLLAVSGFAPAATSPSQADYVENQIIVKFRRTVTDTLETKLTDGVSANDLKLSRSLDNLNKKYRLRKARPLFKNFRKNRQYLNALQKKDKALLSKKENRILRRLKRAPKDAKVPELDRIYTLEVELEPGQSIENVVAAYKNDPGVDYVSLNYVFSIDGEPNDPLYPEQWPLNNTGQIYPESGYYTTPPGIPDCDIDARQAWDINVGSSEIIVAVVDTGVDYLHRDLKENRWINEAEMYGGVGGVDDDGNGYVDDCWGYDFCTYGGETRDRWPFDLMGHGTHCAGIIAADTNNGLDIAGVAWNAKIMALKYMDAYGYGLYEDVVDAFYYAVENAADIISNSWGKTYPFDEPTGDPMQDVINYAYSQGVIVVASAGNNSSIVPCYPACYDHVIAVAATDSKDKKASFSNYGDWVDIAAPGVDVLSLRGVATHMGTEYGEKTTILSGTSMSCPHVAGVLALILSAQPELSTELVIARLIETADDISALNPGLNEPLISRRVNAYKAIRKNFDGIVTFDRDLYLCNDIVNIEVSDFDLINETSQQIIITTDAGDEETIITVQDTSMPWLFTGTINTSTAPIISEDGLLQVSHDQVLTATYNDDNDGSGGPAIAEGVATIDCQGPVIFNVEVFDIVSSGAKVRFETDEPTTASAHGGLVCGGTYTSTGDDLTLATSHIIYLSGLTSETGYHFVVDACDVMANETTDSNEGLCYSFTTTAPPEGLLVPAEYATIQAAIDAAVDGNTIWVAGGTYTGEGNYKINFNGKKITVKSESGPEYCIVDCQWLGSGFYFSKGEDSNSILDGFTITNSGYYDEGICCGVTWIGSDNPLKGEPLIRNCIIKNNYTGIQIGRCSPTISNCIITGNSGEHRGGIYCLEYSNPTIINCIITGNRAYGYHGRGAGIKCWCYGNANIINCVISGNFANNSGGGIFSGHHSTVTITNCTITENFAGSDGGAIYVNEANAIIRNSILYGNTAEWGKELSFINGAVCTVSYSNIQGGQADAYVSTSSILNWGEGNIDVDPAFASPIKSDYHLMPGSLCIDAGDPCYVAEPNETDLDGNPRVIGGRIDMGAYEFMQPIEVQMKFTPQALNLSSKGRWVKAHFVLPEGFAVEDVDAITPAVIEPFGVESYKIKVLLNDDGLVKVQATFRRSDLCSSITSYDQNIEVMVIGRFTNGQQFYGTDIIKITDRAFDHLAILVSHWLEDDCRRPHWCDGADLNRDSVVNFLDFALLDP